MLRQPHANSTCMYKSQRYTRHSKQQQQLTSSERESKLAVKMPDPNGNCLSGIKGDRDIVLRGSMNAKDNCYNNTCVESFFLALKVECIHVSILPTWK